MNTFFFLSVHKERTRSTLHINIYTLFALYKNYIRYWRRVIIIAILLRRRHDKLYQTYIKLVSIFFCFVNNCFILIIFLCVYSCVLCSFYQFMALTKTCYSEIRVRWECYKILQIMSYYMLGVVRGKYELKRIYPA